VRIDGVIDWFLFMVGCVALPMIGGIVFSRWAARQNPLSKIPTPTDDAPAPDANPRQWWKTHAVTAETLPSGDVSLFMQPQTRVRVNLDRPTDQT